MCCSINFRGRSLFRKRGAYFLLFMALVLLFSFLQVAYAGSLDGVKVRLAVFPFNDMSTDTLDTNIPAVLRSELSRYEFIEVIPVETVTRKIYEIEPSLLWTEKKGGEKRGGILWTVQPNLIKEVKQSVSADVSIYGELTRFGKRWRISARITEDENQGTEALFMITGLNDEEMTGELTGLAKTIADVLKGKNALREAEEYVRRYRGAVYTYTAVLEKIKGLVNSFYGSVPLHALLLDLYLQQKERNADNVLSESLKIMEIYDPEKGDDTRYLLSLNIDPFLTAAEIYEGKQEWSNAIAVRMTGLDAFPYRNDQHRIGLGRDYYLWGSSQEKAGQRASALESYEKSLTFLKPSSEFFQRAEEGIERLRGSHEYLR
jgi:hypothetical protein